MEGMSYKGWTIEKVQYTPGAPGDYCTVTLKASRPGHLVKTFTVSGESLSACYAQALALLGAHALRVRMEEQEPLGSPLSPSKEQDGDPPWN